MTCDVVEYPVIPAGIDTTPVLFIEIASITLFNDIPKEVDMYEMFHPLLPFVKK